jgi:hypothetical protein
MLYMSVSTHAPENCPAFNPKTRAIFHAYFAKAEALSKKYGVKIVGSWTDHPAHTNYVVMDIPSEEAAIGFMMEPEIHAMLGFCTMRSFPVMTDEQTLKIIKEAK